MERVLLYYPSINIPDSNWLRNSLLYTDKVASIFPFYNIDDKQVNDDTRVLYDAGLYKPISVFEELNPFHIELEKFETNYIETISSEQFRLFKLKLEVYDRKTEPGFGDYEMYASKLTRRVKDYLKENNLLVSSYDSEVRIEKYSAIIYMSMLANYLARINRDLVTPSTDKPEYERLAYQLADRKELAYRIQLNNCLPVPAPTVKIKEIIEFKRKRKHELLKFREVLDKFESEINQIEDGHERKRKIVQFKENIEKEIIEIKKLLGDSKKEFMLNIALVSDL